MLKTWLCGWKKHQTFYWTKILYINSKNCNCLTYCVGLQLVHSKRTFCELGEVIDCVHGMVFNRGNYCSTFRNLYYFTQCSHFSDLSSFFKSIYALCKRVVHVRDWTETYSHNRRGRAFKLYYPVIIWLIFKVLKIVSDLLLPNLFFEEK